MESGMDGFPELLERYEARLRSRLFRRNKEDQETGEALASTLQEVDDNIAADLARLEKEETELQDQVLAGLAAIEAKESQKEELKGKAQTLKNLHMRSSEEAKQELDRKRAGEDREQRTALQQDLERLIQSRPAKKRRTTSSQDGGSLALSPNTEITTSSQYYGGTWGQRDQLFD
ncbi:hypothetical protein ACHAPT_006227 [Fusarium lateritium]